MFQPIKGNSAHYDACYFERQRRSGQFGGTADLFKFEEYIKPNDHVIDFGCGGGYLLRNLVCAQKIGIEINDVARAEAKRLGIRAVADVDEVPDAFADIVVSNHSLEHIYCPYDALVSLKPKIKHGGILLFVVPHQGPGERFREDDVNQHLYTWNPLTLGNLFAAAGYLVCQVKTIRHKWPPYYERIRDITGIYLFNRICQAYAIMLNSNQLRIVARNES